MHAESYGVMSALQRPQSLQEFSLIKISSRGILDRL